MLHSAKLNQPFYIITKKLENVKDFVYLGVTLTTNGISQKSVQAKIQPTHRAIFSTLSMCRANELPIDLKLELFQKIVASCTLHGTEIYINISIRNFAIQVPKIRLKTQKCKINSQCS